MTVFSETAVLSGQDAEAFIGQYYGLLIEDPKQRERLIQLARPIVAKNISDYGVHTPARLQITLDEILDNHLPGKEWEPVSLNADLTGEGFTLEQVLAAPEERAEAEIEAEMKEAEARGARLLGFIRHSLSEADFESLVTMLGGAENAASILGSTNLIQDDVSSAGSQKDLINLIRWLSGLSPETRALYATYSIYQRGREKGDGKRRQNPIVTLDALSFPIVQIEVQKAYERRPHSLVSELRRLGLDALLKSYGVGGLVRLTNPELLHRIHQITKWRNGQESVQTALNTIQKMLFTLLGYRRAEETGDREDQVRIINQWVAQGNLTEYFNSHELGGLMAAFVDPTGEKGIRKQDSPKAALKFYSEMKGLGWFDRTQPTYVPAWRIKERNIRRIGEESAQLAIEVIEDGLYTLPAYREAELSGNRQEQLRIIGQILTQKGQQRANFEKAGLTGLMINLIDPTGRTWPKKRGSISAWFEFYSERKRLDWFSPAYAVLLAANKSGRLEVVDRRQEWQDGQYGSRSSYEGTGLEEIVNDAMATYGLQQGIEEFCYMLFSKRDALLANSFKERVILAYRLGVFLYMAGVIPRILSNGEARRLGPEISDLAFMGYSYFTHVEKRADLDSAVVDKQFNRLMMSIVKQNTREAGPSVEEIIDEVGQHPLTVKRYGRPVSYDDVLPALTVMERYMRGQRAVTIRIGSLSMQMTPEAIDDLWVLNPTFIKFRHDERLYLFWQRNRKDWSRLVNIAGQRKMVTAHLGEAATYDVVESNSKAKFIKKGALPSRELVRLGGLAMTEQKSQKGRRGKSAVSEVDPKQLTGRSENEQSQLYGGRRVINYGVFKGYVPRDQLAAEVFRRRFLERVTRRPIYTGEAVALAEEVGFESRRGNGIDAQVRKILREWPNEMPKIVELVDPNASNIKNAPSYWGLEKYLEEKGEPVNGFLYEPLEQAVKGVHQEYNQKAIHQSVGIIVGMLEHSGVLTKGDLENLLASGNLDNIRSASGRGLVSRDPSQRAYLNYFVTACEAAGFDVTKVKALVREAAASSA